MNRLCTVGGCDHVDILVRGYCRRHYAKFRRYGDPLGGRKTADGDALRFIDSLPVSGTECIAWPFGVNASGYGAYYKGTAHSFICEKFHGKKPSSMHVAAHSCGNGNEACVAPYHLSWKTYKGNSEDRERHGNTARGEKTGTSKLTAEQVNEIRGLIPILPFREIGRRFNVSKFAIQSIANGNTWKHIPQEA